MSKIEMVKVTLEVPKAFVNHIKNSKWFKICYRDFQDFMMDSARLRKENLEKTFTYQPDEI